MSQGGRFLFEISLSVLNHLGRNLYRSFVTVLGEAISNSWDADAENVWITIDKANNRLIIKDDGIGMTKKDFQKKFLRIGFSKRNLGKSKSPNGRPFIGRKGIGKLALLSCADRITIASKVKRGQYVGGTIDNSGLDKAITKDLTPQHYRLEKLAPEIFGTEIDDHKHGTLIMFQGIKGGIKNSAHLLRKVVALYFRFSLVDNSFKIHLNGKTISFEDLHELAERTEFLWETKTFKDPFLDQVVTFVKERKKIQFNSNVQGFIASVRVPRDLTIMGLDERVTVDLFVNGRIREKNILKHIPTARIAEDYLYGQIHFNSLDDAKKDRFTSDREGVVADDEKYKKFLAEVKEHLLAIINDWDRWRLLNREPGDVENLRISPRERMAKQLFDVVSTDFTPVASARNKQQIENWVNSLSDDAQFNFGSYAECFISENLIRKLIKEKRIPLSSEALAKIEDYKKKETESKGRGNVSIEIRRLSEPTSYLSMNELAYLVDKDREGKNAALSHDADQYKPIRDALAHTGFVDG